MKSTCLPLNKPTWVNSTDELLIDYAIHTEIPVGSHRGSFGIQRTHHMHTGIDLYCSDGNTVYALEDGIVVSIGAFTGEEVGSPWWNSTEYCMIASKSGTINYGEIICSLKSGQTIKRGDIIGHVRKVLKTDKGRPTSMLHLELYNDGIISPCDWDIGDPTPHGLLDPTELLLKEIK